MAHVSDHAGKMGRSGAADREAFRGKRVGFVMHPEVGHLLPALQLAKWVRDSGGEVVFLGPPDFEELIAREQLGYVSVIAKAQKGYIEAWARACRARARDESVRVPPDLRTLLLGLVASSEAEAIIAGLGLHLLCVDPFLWPFLLVARKLEIPAIVLETDVVRRVSRFDDAGRQFHCREIVLAPRRIAGEPETDGEPPRTFLGPSIDLTRTESEFPWEWLSDKPIVYMSLGTNTHLYKSSEHVLVTAARGLCACRDVQLVVHEAGSRPATLPKGVVVSRRVPQLRMLERAAVFVSHGGLGAIKEAIHFGVPMIVFPMTEEQRVNAATVQRLGLGIAASPEEVSEASIASQLEQLVQGGYREALAALRTRIAMDREFEQGLSVLRSVIAGVM
jgi:UDP:flavonoid glycosyltransferase YjiC (YdhE family)